MATDPDEKFESFVEDPNRRNLNHLSDAAELGNPNVICRKYADVPIYENPGNPAATSKGYISVSKPERPKADLSER